MRVKRGVNARKKRRKILKMAKGYYGARRRLYRVATEAVERALKFAFRDRRARKREFRSIWIARISAAARQNNISYSRLINGMKKTGMELDRKTLSEIAIFDPQAFSRIVSEATSQSA